VPSIKLSKNFVVNICKKALNEDLYPSGDITTNLINNNLKKKVKLLSNQKGIIGGLEFAKQTFKLIDKKIKIKIKKKEGSLINKGDLIAIIEGNIKNILIGERVALNFLSHISGIATKTNSFVKKLSKKSKIFIAGHKGMVGSSIQRKLKKLGYKNLLVAEKKKLTY